MSVKGPALASAFGVAVQTAKQIHFNLEGIKSVRGVNNSNAYNDFAQNFGSKGDIAKTVQWLDTGNPPPPFVTADELYQVKRNPTLCQKTTFYKRGSLTLTDVVGNTQICGQ